MEKKLRDMALWAHVPLGGTKGSGVPETGSPAVVVHQQVGEDLAALQIETVEVRQSMEVAALEHGTALARVVEADHGGQEHEFATAQDAEGIVRAEERRVGRECVST